MQHFATRGNLGHLTDTNVPGTKGLNGSAKIYIVTTKTNITQSSLDLLFITSSPQLDAGENME